jgi:hypothetical protein
MVAPSLPRRVCRGLRLRRKPHDADADGHDGDGGPASGTALECQAGLRSGTEEEEGREAGPPCRGCTPPLQHPYAAEPAALPSASLCVPSRNPALSPSPCTTAPSRKPKTTSSKPEERCCSRGCPGSAEVSSRQHQPSVALGAGCGGVACTPRVKVQGSSKHNHISRYTSTGRRLPARPPLGESLERFKFKEGE